MTKRANGTRSGERRPASPGQPKRDERELSARERMERARELGRRGRAFANRAKRGRADGKPVD